MGRPFLTLRTRGEFMALWMLATSVAYLNASVARSLGLSSGVVATVSWPIDVGVDAFFVTLAGATLRTLRAYNSRRCAKQQ